MLELKPDFDNVLDRYEAWWDCTVLDRPLVSMTFPVPEAARKPVPQKKHASLRDRWMDSEYIAAQAYARLRFRKLMEMTEALIDRGS